MNPYVLSWCRAFVSITLWLILTPQAQAAETTIVTLRDARPVDGIEVEIVSGTSGVSIQTGRSADGGVVHFKDLSEGVHVQVQTLDGNNFSESFLPGSTVELELGRAGWNLAGTVGFAVGSSAATFKSDTGLDADRSDIGGGPEVGIILFAPPRQIIFKGVRPFFATSAQLGLLDPVDFKGDGGGVAEVQDEWRIRIGGGVAIPFNLASRTLTAEPSVRYAVTGSEVSSRPAGQGKRSKTFTSHAVELGLVLDVPLGKLGPVGVGLDLGVQGLFPISGKGTVNSDLSAEPSIGVQGTIGIRGTFAGIFGSR